MNKLYPILIFFSFALLKPQNATADNTLVQLAHHCFKANDQQYIEFNFWLASNSLAYQKIDSSTYQAGVEVTILFFEKMAQGDHFDTKIKQYDKYILNGPLTAAPVDFRDVKRYRLPKGEYKYEVKMIDLHQQEVYYQFQDTFNLSYSEVQIEQSGIQLLDKVQQSKEATSSFVKSGLLMEPSVGNFYGKSAPKLIAYHEVYNADKVMDGSLNVRYFITKAIGGRTKELIVKNKPLAAKKIHPLLLQMDLKNLASGQYKFHIEIRDQSYNLLSSKNISFSRANPNLRITREQLSQEAIAASFVAQLDEEQLRYSLKALATNVANLDIDLHNNLIASENRADKERFLLSYFLTLNPNEPELDYQNYMTFVKQVDEKFRSGLGYGFETDRGYIYMKYGAPNDVVSIENEPDAPPYEIWFYYEFPTTRQANVKFLFYNPNLSPGDYQLLHSNALGELQNPQWLLELYKKIPNEINGNNYFDATSMKSGINRRAAEYFKEY